MLLFTFGDHMNVIEEHNVDDQEHQGDIEGGGCPGKR